MCLCYIFHSGHDQWDPWSPWGACSASCDHGKRQRTRQCALTAMACRGNGKETEYCNLRRCDPTKGTTVL